MAKRKRSKRRYRSRSGKPRKLPRNLRKSLVMAYALDARMDRLIEADAQ